MNVVNRIVNTAPLARILIFVGLIGFMLHPTYVHAQVVPIRIYVAPVAAGLGDGSTAQDPTTLDKLDTLTQQLNGKGGEILLAGGTYTNINAVINGSGIPPDQLLIIRGIVLSTNVTLWPQLQNVSFTFKTGASNIRMSHLQFNTCDSCIVATEGPITNVIFQDMYALNVNHFFNGGPGAATPAPAHKGMTFNNIKVDNNKLAAILLAGATTDILITGSYFSYADNNPPTPPVGMIEIDDTVKNVTITKTTIINTINNAGGLNPPNSDGIQSAAGTDNISIQNSYIGGFTNAGVNLQSITGSITGTTFVGNRANMRILFGHPYTMTTIQSYNARDAHIEVVDSDVDTTIATFTNSVFETGPSMADPTVPAGKWLVDSGRCGMVSITGGHISHDPAALLNEHDCTTTTPKVTYTSVVTNPMNPNPIIPPIPDNTTINNVPVVPLTPQAAARHNTDPAKKSDFDLLLYFVMSGLFIMVIHFALAIKDQFNVWSMMGIFLLGGLFAWMFQRYEVGFIFAAVASLLFW
jgi:hypothetical protein